MAEETHYYAVSLALGATWKKNIYTYNFNALLAPGSIVNAPFGKATKIGYVISKETKPSIKTKALDSYIGQSISTESMNLINWLNERYPNMPGVHTQHFLPSYLSKINDFSCASVTNYESPHLKTLTSSQSRAMKTILGSGKTTVLHGITGSGKTRVYSELADAELSKGKNVLIVYPEISLTTQLENSLINDFGDERVNVFHSKRTPTEMKKAWIKSLNTSQGMVTIGPRSSLFLPHKNLGLVVLDEAHDSSYKQDNGSRYNGLNVAAQLANVHGAQLVLGSATPPIQETEQIVAKGGQIVCMHELAIANSHAKRNFKVIDMTDKSNRSQKSFMLSKVLMAAVKTSLENNMQTLLFLNRRGTAHMLMCEQCGWHAECSRCEMPMTYHHDNHKLQCHVCGLSLASPNTCPDCSGSLTQKSPGTKSIEKEIEKLFPDARVVRFDSDNSKKDSFSEQYNKVKDGKVDILIGTQLLTKGLDLPKLETVGILQADSQLYLPDYTSEERAFQQLSQVSGRVGRGHSEGRVILQTYQPKNKLFELVESQDWHHFYTDQLLQRKGSGFPPYSFMMKITASKTSSKAAETAVTKLARELVQTNRCRILGPAPSFYFKSNGKYSWQLIAQSNSRKKLEKIAKELPKDFIYDLDPIGLL